jgi:hypothetical protein
MYRLGTGLLVLITLATGQVSFSPDSLDQTLLSGETALRTLNVTNTDSVVHRFAVTIVDQTGARWRGNRNAPRPSYGLSRDGAFPQKGLDYPAQVFTGGGTVTFQGPNGTLVEGIRCATPTPSPAAVQQSYLETSHWVADHPEVFTRRDQVAILVAFHVILASDGTGDISDEMIQDQIEVLNAAYAPYGVTYVLDIIDRTVNDTWFYNIDSYESQVKQALAVDPYHYLNIYTAQPGNNILGWAYFPSSFPEGSPMHGLVLLYSTLPGGSAYPYNAGDTATHEVGHYLGLYHTFANGCSFPGDAVDDTPYQDDGDNIYVCNEALDTCPSEGLDPVHNFMNYTDDACLTEFTIGQGERMIAQINLYRPGLLENPVAPAWIVAAADTLTVPVDSTVSLDVTFDATELIGGDYYAEMQFADLGFDTVQIVPVHLEVIGIPAMEVSVDSLLFGSTFLNQTDSALITIGNTGTGVLVVHSITVEPSVFTVHLDSGVIEPGGTLALTIYFTPAEAVTYSGSLVLESNDPDSALWTVPVVGTGVIAPAMTVTPDSLGLVLESGHQDTLSLVIGNTGGSDLEYTIAVRAAGGRIDRQVDREEWQPSSFHLRLLDTGSGRKVPGGLYNRWLRWERSAREDSVSALWEDFEAGFPGDWTDESGVWQVGTAGPASSQYFPVPEHTQFVYINDDAAGSGAPPVDAYLITPEINCTDFISVGLSLASFYPTTGSGQYANQAEILIREVGADWSVIAVDPVEEEWTTLSYDLTDLAAGRIVQLGFRFTDLNGNWAYGWGIDDVVLTGVSTTPEWITTEPVAGIVPADDSVTVLVLFDATGLSAGGYQAHLVVQSNDPITPETEVQVSLEVTGNPVLQLGSTAIDFETSYVGYPDTAALYVTNLGAVTLSLGDFATTDPRLTVSVDSLNIPPFSGDSLLLFFLSDTIGSFSGALSFTTNDTAYPTVQIPVVAEVFDPPAVQIATDPITLHNGENVTVEDSVTLANGGGSDLDYSIEVVYPGGSEQVIVVYETFAGCALPAGWTRSTNSQEGGWLFSDNGSSTYWTVPPGDGCYAYSNDDAANDDGSMDYLVAPALDLTEFSSFWLIFDSYYDGSYSQMAYVELSLDGGTSWSVLSTVEPQPVWTQITIDLTEYVGLPQVLVAFHSDDNGEWASGWAVDNVTLGGFRDRAWLTVEPTTGVLAPEGEVQLHLIADATGLETDQYYAYLNITSNDPAQPEVLVPIIFDVTSLGIASRVQLPVEFALHPNYPNPFNPVTTIRYDLPEPARVRIVVYDLLGRQVKTLLNGARETGYWTVRWDGTDDQGQAVGAGVYLYRIETERFTQTRKMILLK